MKAKLHDDCSGGVPAVVWPSGTGILPVMGGRHGRDGHAPWPNCSGVFAAVACVLLFAGFAHAQEPVTPARELTPSEQKAADLRLPALDRTALLPERRTPTDVPVGERNPFGTVSLPPPEEKEAAPIEAETEEIKIRRVLGNMRVSGLSGGEGSYVIQIGPMMLRAGDPVPRLFFDQAEILHVQSITDRSVIFSFAEKDPNFPPRTIGVNFDLSPRVRALLAGDFLLKTIPMDRKGVATIKPLENPTIKALSDSLGDEAADALIERHPELMGDTSFAPQANDPKAPKHK